MQFAIGDKVSFLNEKGGGVVSAIISKDFVSVAVEEGFDLRMHVSELIRDARAVKPTEVLPPEILTEKTIIPLPVPDVNIIGETGVFLVLVPVEAALDPLDFRIYIANNTNYKLLYSFNIRLNNRDEGKASGILEAAGFTFLQYAGKKDIERWDSVMIRLIFHKDGLSQAASLAEHRFIIRSQLLSASRLKKMPLMQMESFSFLIANPRQDAAFIPDEKPPTRKPQQKSRDEDVPAGARHFRLDTFTHHVEIDLHIEELIENISGLNNTEIIRIQLQKFQLALDHAIAKNMKKIFVIHGVGNGTLKREIRQVMDAYPEVSYSDAPSRHYGAGATEVNIK
jgi:DNA-nicking Smr family endonuclease